MRDFPSCFGENGVQVADASCSSVAGNKGPQNSVTCIYRCKFLGKSCLISIIWSKNLMGQCLSVEIDDCRVDLKPSLFSKGKGSKILQVNSRKIEVFWDLSMARFGPGPEPVEGYYVAVVSKGEMALLVGDMSKEAFKKTGAVASLFSPSFISKREHISGKRVYCTKAKFCENGPLHDLRIESDPNCKGDPPLVIHIDAKTVMRIEHLQWKFRGNYTILLDGLPVQVFWDVHDWLFGPGLGNAVFMFRSSSSAEKMCDSLVFDRSCSDSLREAELAGHGFSLFLYAWRNE